MNQNKTPPGMEPTRHWINGEWINRLNTTVFGMAAAIFTNDVDRVQSRSRRQAGTVWINTWELVNGTFEKPGQA